MRPPFSRLPALPIAAGMSLGILAAEWGCGWAFASIASLAFVVLYAMRRNYPAFVVMAGAAGALLAIAKFPAPFPEDAAGKFSDCSGSLISASLGDNSQRCVVKIDSIDGRPCNHPFKCLVVNRHIVLGLCPGARVSFYSELFPLEDKALLPNEANYGKYLKYEGISARTAVFNESMAVTAPPGRLRQMLNSVHEAMARGISGSSVSPVVSAFFLTTILGEDDFLSEDTRSNFQDAGLSHILALSGLHVGIIASFLAILFSPLRLFPNGRKLQSGLIVFFVWLYAVATGLGPSVTRAAVMLSAMMLARMLERGNYPFNSLCVALIVVLAINPYSLFTPGLQMSFAAVTAILLAARAIPPAISSRPILAFLLGLIVVPIAAMLGTGIVGAYYFHSFPMLFLPANIAIALVFPLLLVDGIALMLTTLAGCHFAWLASSANFLHQLTISTASVFSGASSLKGLFFTAWAILPFWNGLFLFSEFAKRRIIDKDEFDKRRRLFLIWGSASFLLSAVLIFALRNPAPKAELYLPSSLHPQSFIMVTTEHAYLWPIGKNVDRAEALEKYNSRYANFLSSRGHSSFEIMPDSLSACPFMRRGPFLISGDRFFFVADSDTLPRGELRLKNETSAAPATPLRPSRIIIGSGFSGPISKIAQKGDTIILCRGINGNRLSSLRRQCADTIHILSTPLPLSITFP
ncbi:MAG: ComEC/Rec2 family competence protein [Clostridium sp.]|nr:ComEC/Rec2 family competence protein [Clostridium sp.]